MAHHPSNCTCCNQIGGEKYMYRRLGGKEVFTGFVQSGRDKTSGVLRIEWIGTDDARQPPRRISPDDPASVESFLKEMSRYDKVR